MTKFLCFGAMVAFLGNVAFAADGRRAVSSASSKVASAVLAQSDRSVLPALSPTPDPLYTPGVESTIVQTRAVAEPTVPVPSPAPAPASTVLVPQPDAAPVATAVELFGDVRYHGLRKVSPCAVPTIIQVPNPCIKDRCCKNCVNVQVCVPPCDPKLVRVTRDGNRVRYDYGKYAVLVRVVGNHIVVSYDA